MNTQDTTLPPLPGPFGLFCGVRLTPPQTTEFWGMLTARETGGEKCNLYTEIQLQDYARADRAAQAAQPLDSIEQYRLQMAGISTAAIGYWKEGDGIHPDYDTLALRDVAKLYAKYDALYKAQQAQGVPAGHKLLEDGNTAIPADWVPLRLEWEPGYPEDVAFGPQRMMDRLKKWLDRHFATLVAARTRDWMAEFGFEIRHDDNGVWLLVDDCGNEREATLNERVLWDALTAAPVPAAAPQAEPQTKTSCEYCDGTGDVHSLDGEWRGKCNECPAAALHAFKNFHRLLCERFGYGHDEKDWQRDQVSLIEFIAGKAEPQPEREPIPAMTWDQFKAASRVEFSEYGEDDTMDTATPDEIETAVRIVRLVERHHGIGTKGGGTK